MSVPATSGRSSDVESLVSSQLTGREFGREANLSLSTDSTSNLNARLAGSSHSLSNSTFIDGPITFLRSNESLASVTTDSKPPSQRSNISLTPPENEAAGHGSHLNSTKKILLGLVIVVLIALSWVGSTQTAKSSFAEHKETNTTFKAPFFIVWFSTGWMMVVFPLSCVLFFAVNRDKWNLAGVKELWSDSTQLFSKRGITPLSLLTSTVLFTLIWAATNYMYTRALTLIEPSDVTALFSSAPAFVFILSLIILREPPLVFRLVAVAMVVLGIVLFAYEDGFKDSGTKDNVIGVALSVGAAIGAAIYKVLLKARVKDASVYQMSLFLSSLGLFSTLFLWPIVLVLQFTGTEEIHGSNVEIPWELICISSALSVIFNFSINFGIAYTYPLFISLGTVLGIPVNGVVDMLLRRADLFLTWKFTATDLIVGGFLLMLLPPSDSLSVQRLCCCYCCRTRRHRMSTGTYSVNKTVTVDE